MIHSDLPSAAFSKSWILLSFQTSISHPLSLIPFWQDRSYLLVRVTPTAERVQTLITRWFSAVRRYSPRYRECRFHSDTSITGMPHSSSSSSYFVCFIIYSFRFRGFSSRPKRGAKLRNIGTCVHTSTHTHARARTQHETKRNMTA